MVQSRANGPSAGTLITVISYSLPHHDNVRVGDFLESEPPQVGLEEHGAAGEEYDPIGEQEGELPPLDKQLLPEVVPRIVAGDQGLN